MRYIICLLILLSMHDTYAQDKWLDFQIPDLQSKRENSGKGYLPFLSNKSFNAGIYELKEGAIDGQPVHKLDEIYYVIKGEAKLEAQDSLYDAKPGSVLFVRAGIKHKFIEIKSDLSVLVVFSETPSNPGDPDSNGWNVEQLRSAGDALKNTWNQFLFVSTMRMGLYQLPLKVGGDQPLTHKVDEINIVTKGSATFTVGNVEIPVSPGSIVWVAAGNPHSFSNLSEDFDVLITFQVR